MADDPIARSRTTPGYAACMTTTRSIGFWVRRVDALIADRVAGLLEEHGVTRTQWHILTALSHGPASNESLDATVAPYLRHGDSESSSDHLAELSESGWIVTKDGANTLTDRGRTAFARLSEVVTRCRESVPTGVTDDERETTVSVLEHVARDLGWTNDDDPE